MERAPAAPRVYVPLNMPEGAAPTYAVLEFVGLSSPVLQQHQRSPPSPSASCAASSLALSVPRGPATEYSLPPPLLPSSRFAPLSPNPVGSALTYHRDQQLGHFHGGPKQEIIHVIDSPPSSPEGNSSSVTSPSLTLRSSAELRAVPPTMASQFSVKNSNMARSSLPSSLPSLSENSGLPQLPVSVSQTDRGTVIHTHSSNFRDVVRQLTGASSSDQDLLPVTLPARLAKRANNIGPSNAATTGTAAGAFSISTTSTTTSRASTGELGLRKAPLKLHERRKAMRSLEKVSPAYLEVPKLVIPSPVTPLASDFERFCTATTPTLRASISPIKPATPPIVESCVRGAPIVQKGAYVFEKQAPTLLNLFPESPVASPRDL